MGAGEQCGRNVEPERFGGLKVDHQLELGWLQDRQVGGLGALENPPDVYARLAIVVAAAASIADQAAGRGELACIVDRGHRVATGQSYNLTAANAKEWIVGYQERTISSPDEIRESRIDLTFAAGVENVGLLSDGARGHLHVV